MTWTTKDGSDCLQTRRPVAFHWPSLTQEIATACGTKPSLRFDTANDPLCATFPGATLTRAQRVAVEVAVDNHDGTEALAADAAAAAAKQAEREARQTDLAKLRAAAAAGPLSAEQATEATRLMLLGAG